MEDILRKKKRRTIFFQSLLLILLALLTIRIIFQFTLDENYDGVKILLLIIDSFFISILTTITLTYLYYRIGKIDSKESFKLIEGQDDIERKFDKQRQKAIFWYFNGGIGRYSRTVTLPRLYKTSKEKGTDIIVTLVIMNPNNSELCQKYADYKNKLGFVKNKNWTATSVRKHLFATILKSVYYENQNNGLQISIYIKDYFSLMRSDINQNVAIITKEDSSIPVLEIKKESYLYAPYKEDFVQTLNQANQVIITKDVNLDPNLSEITVEEAASFFANIKLARLNNFEAPNKQEIKDILEIIVNDPNPYPSTYKPKV